MILLLDTHTFLWFCQGDPALSATAKALLEDPASRKLVSLACCREVSIKAGLGKLNWGEPCETYLPNALAASGLELFPITLDHVIAAGPLPLYHRDPFDRLIVAQSLVEGFPVVGNDVAFDPYGVTRLW